MSPLLKPTRTNVVMASLPRLSDTHFHLTPYQGIRYKNLSRRFCSHYSHPPPFQLVEILPTILPPRLACQASQPPRLHGASRFQAHLIFDIFGRTIFCLKICAKNCTNSNTIYIATLKTAFFRSARTSCTTFGWSRPARKIWITYIQAYMPYESSEDSSNQPDGCKGSP